MSVGSLAFQRVPFFGRNLSAGNQGQVEYLPILNWVNIYIPPALKSKRLIAAEIYGDSLIEAGIYEGDLAVIELTKDARNGQLVAALTGEGSLVKYFYREASRIRLEGRNASYAPRYFSHEQIKIQGIVRQIIRKIQ